MPSLTEFLKTDLAKEAIVKGTIDGWIAKAEGKGLEVLATYRESCQAEADMHKKIKIWALYALAANQENEAFLKAFTCQSSRFV